VFDAWILLSRVVDPSKKVPNLNCEVQLGSVIRSSGSQIRGAGSEIRRDPPHPKFNPCYLVVLLCDSRVFGALCLRYTLPPPRTTQQQQRNSDVVATSQQHYDVVVSMTSPTPSALVIIEHLKCSDGKTNSNQIYFARNTSHLNAASGNSS